MTKNQEDYLKAIYELGGQYKKIGTKAIAEALGVSPPSVSDMITKLLQAGYVKYTSYYGVTLTSLGLEQALKVKKRHHLWEVFLAEKLGYGLDEIHAEAEILEHVTSSKLEEALDEFLNYPKTCPHGKTIIRNYKKSPTLELRDN